MTYNDRTKVTATAFNNAIVKNKSIKLTKETSVNGGASSSSLFVA